MISSPSRQQGLTFMGFVMLMTVLGFFLLLLFKIGPIYLDHYKVVSALHGLKSDPDLASRTPQEILATLDKRFDIDMIKSVSTKENVYITKDIGQITVQIAYDVTEHILANIDVIVHFDNSIEAKSN